MMLRLNFSSLRSVSIFAIVGWLAPGATAGGVYDPSNDPFVGRRTNAGEAMSGTPSNNYFGYGVTYVSSLLVVPPLPPVIGEAVPHVVAAASGRTGLRDLSREIFFGGAALLAGEEDLLAKEARRIAAYRRSRQQVFDEIKAKFDELAGATPAARQVALTELATQQASRLQALESEAEAIRNDLARVDSTFGYDIEIRVDAPPFNLSAAQQSELFFGAYFYAGLSIEQRLLLPEIAYEQAPASPNEGSKGASSFFFLPATTRVQPPANLPPALEAKIRDFTREKDALKGELRSAVLQHYFLFTSPRTRRLTELAGKQAPRFAALEALAEEIRVGLAAAGFPEQKENLALPADLTQRVGRFYARKVQVRHDLLNRLWSLRNEYIGATFEIVRKGDGLAIEQTVGEPVALLAKFNADQARQYAAFTTESETLRRDIQHYLENHPQRTPRTVDQLAADFVNSYDAREKDEQYRNYVRAVLEPGLSPAQRRLMFGAALAEVEQTGASVQP